MIAHGPTRDYYVGLYIGDVRYASASRVFVLLERFFRLSWDK